MGKIIDLHCDTISALLEKQEAIKDNSCHFDINRAKQGGLAIQFFALFARPDDSNTVLRKILKQIEKYYREISVNEDELYPILEFNDILSAANQNKIGCLLHLEGAEALGSDVELIKVFYRLGLRSIGLTWNYRNLMADGVNEETNAGGLSEKGRLLIRELSSLGIILDLAHLGPKSFFEAIEYYDAPLIVSHANARNLCPHRRNLSDEQFKAVQANGGVVGVTGVNDFISVNDATIEDLIDHIVYITDLIGGTHVALGSDFDGADRMVMTGIDDYQHWEHLLQKRGFLPGEIENILYGNALRILKAIL